MFYYIQAWIGVGLVIVWFFIISALKYRETAGILRLDDENKSCSDYSIVIEGMPYEI
jgi:hypothetical protein